jgi:hypothetical protein
MKRPTPLFAVVFAALLVAASPFAAPPLDRAEALWAAREDLSKAKEALQEYETALKSSPNDYDILVRLSRLHYWIGMNLEGSNEKEALAHFQKGEAWLMTAAKRRLLDTRRRVDVREAAAATIELELSTLDDQPQSVLPDERLRLLFVCAPGHRPRGANAVDAADGAGARRRSNRERVLRGAEDDGAAAVAREGEDS